MAISPSSGPGPVLVIGAGIAGLTCARSLADQGIEVLVVDKGRRPGGRISTRSTDAGSWDHGAQYFTARDERFRRYVRSWAEHGVVAPWAGRIRSLAEGRLAVPESTTERWVGTPGMRSLGAHLARGLEIRLGCRIDGLEPHRGQWRATARNGATFGARSVVVAAPAPQSAALLEQAPDLREAVLRVRMTPTWAVLVGFSDVWPLAADGAFVSASPLSWIARDSSKPDRHPGERWVLHAAADWSTEHLEDRPVAVGEALLDALREASGLALPTVESLQAHRWRYAGVEVPLGQESLWDSGRRIGVAGDWCPASRVEGAWTSGAALAREILRT